MTEQGTCEGHDEALVGGRMFEVRQGRVVGGVPCVGLVEGLVCHSGAGAPVEAEVRCIDLALKSGCALTGGVGFGGGTDAFYVPADR